MRAAADPQATCFCRKRLPGSSVWNFEFCHIFFTFYCHYYVITRSRGQTVLPFGFLIHPSDRMVLDTACQALATLVVFMFILHHSKPFSPSPLVSTSRSPAECSLKTADLSTCIARCIFPGHILMCSILGPIAIN